MHVSTLRELPLRDYPAMDRSVVGEGEEAFLAILERDGGDLAEAPGLPPAKPPG